MVTALVAAVPVLAAAACASSAETGEPPTTPERLAGCWTVDAADWEAAATPRREPLDTTTHPSGAEIAVPDPDARRRDPGEALPVGVRLDTARLTGWPSLEREGMEPPHRAASLTGGRPQDHPLGYWRPLPPDSLVVGHPAAYAGVTLRLAVAAPDTLRGRALFFSDVMEGGRSGSDAAPVELRRRACRESEGG